jgi:hypothetical protein
MAVAFARKDSTRAAAMPYALIRPSAALVMAVDDVLRAAPRNRGGMA